MNKTGRRMVFSCSWAVYFTICAAKYSPDRWVEQCGAIPWDNNYIQNKCHMWRYGEDLSPVWGAGSRGSLAKRVLSGGGGSGVGDIIEFASSIFAYNWRAVTGPGAFNDVSPAAATTLHIRRAIQSIRAPNTDVSDTCATQHLAARLSGCWLPDRSAL